MAIKVSLFLIFILALVIFGGLTIYQAIKRPFLNEKLKSRYYTDADSWHRREKTKEELAECEDEINSFKHRLHVNFLLILLFGILSAVVLLGLIFIPGNIHQVNTGEVAVVRHMGKIEGTRDPGIHWDFYITNKYEIYDTKVREINIDTQTYSKDNQIITVQADLQYTIDVNQVDKIASEYGKIGKLESKIKSIALDNIKSVFAQNTATDVINNRSQISASISQIVNDSINQDYYVNVKTIVLTNIDFTDDFEAAVAAKVAAAQEAEKAENEARKAEIEAEAARVVAEKQADAALYKAQKEAEAKLAAATADAEAQLLIANAEAKATKVKAVEVARMLGFNITETVTEDGVEYEIDFSGIQPDDSRYKLMVNYLEYIQYLETWDGTLPVTLVGDGSATVLIPTV